MVAQEATPGGKPWQSVSWLVLGEAAEEATGATAARRRAIWKPAEPIRAGEFSRCRPGPRREDELPVWREACDRDPKRPAHGGRRIETARRLPITREGLYK